MTVRPLMESDRPAMLQIARICFNLPGEWIRNVGSELRLDRYMGVEEHGRLVGVANDVELVQWFGGRTLPCSGVATVGVLPEHRAEGHASCLVTEILQRARRQGFPVSALYPATTRVYRKLGYELAGLRTQFRLSLVDIPAALPGASEIEVVESGLADLAAIQQCYRSFAARHTGLVFSESEDWWRRRVFRMWSESPVRTVIARRRGAPNEVDGYASFLIEAVSGTWSYDLGCTHLVALTPQAAAALAGYFRGFRGLGHSVSWFGPPSEPLAIWLARGADDVIPARVQRFMLRILDAPAALEGRGWPEVTAEVTFALRDQQFPENEGPWRLRVAGGRAQVERSTQAAPLTLDICGLAALYSGHITAHDAVMLGFLPAEDPQLPTFARIFSGPAPWMPDIF